ncbi:hypothetical protein [Anaerococcus prevotii]|nr:hypothetical protein [Anaerococcus prevotii]
MIRQNYLTYSEAMVITQEDLQELTVAVEKVEKEIANEVKRMTKKGR